MVGGLKAEGEHHLREKRQLRC